jgi:hypothetical protein
MKNSKTSPRAGEELKSALVKRFSAEYAEVGRRLVYQAVNEADALASLTSVPLLVLPTLAEEKVQRPPRGPLISVPCLAATTVAFAA